MSSPSRCLPTLLCLLMAAPAAAQSWKPAQIWVAGSDHDVWLVAAGREKDQSLPVLQMWYAAQDELAPGLPRLRLPKFVGDPVCVGADREALRILFSDLGEVDYSLRRGASAGPVWKAVCRARPLAWSGDAAGRVLWALVRTSDLLPETSADSQKRGPSKPGRERPQPPPSTGAKPDTAPSAFTLLALVNGRWQRHGSAPAEAESGDRFWIAARKERVTLFWTEGRQLRASTQEFGAWSPRAVLPVGPLRTGWSGTTPEGAAFVAGLPADESTIQLQLLVERQGEWTSRGEARDGNELLTLDAASSGVGLARGQLAIARRTSGGGIEFGQCPLETAPAVRFSALPTIRENPGAQTRLEDTVALVLLLAIMTIALFSRREEANRSIILPQNLALAAVWRRGLGTLLDLAPAVIITSPWWWPTFSEATAKMEWDATYEQMADEFAQRLRAPRLVTIGLYGLWCFVWEMAIGTSPGKLLFGCRVLSLEGTRPSPRQCFIRNLARAIIVSMGPSGLFATFMTMVLLTRNRQRIGDLLARTIVIEPAPEPQEPPREDGPFGPFE